MASIQCRSWVNNRLHQIRTTSFRKLRVDPGLLREQQEGAGKVVADVSPFTVQGEFSEANYETSSESEALPGSDTQNSDEDDEETASSGKNGEEEWDHALSFANTKTVEDELAHVVGKLQEARAERRLLENSEDMRNIASILVESTTGDEENELVHLTVQEASQILRVEQRREELLVAKTVGVDLLEVLRDDDLVVASKAELSQQAGDANGNDVDEALLEEHAELVAEFLNGAKAVGRAAASVVGARRTNHEESAGDYDALEADLDSDGDFIASAAHCVLGKQPLETAAFQVLRGGKKKTLLEDAPPAGGLAAAICDVPGGWNNNIGANLRDELSEDSEDEDEEAYIDVLLTEIAEDNLKKLEKKYRNLSSRGPYPGTYHFPQKQDRVRLHLKKRRKTNTKTASVDSGTVEKQYRDFWTLRGPKTIEQRAPEAV